MRKTVALILLAALAACGRSPSVDIDGETLLGKRVENDRVVAFLGVPFAEPPVGELRWRAPQPLGSRLQVRDATTFAPACMQSTRILDWYRYIAEAFGASRDYYPDLEVSEDCLYLNVWTPTLEPDARLPVMVWVHGGSNRSGWSYEPNYHGHKLAQRGVVVVSVAYRHGAFGFISHPELAADEPVANFGLWDIVAALEWLQDNVAAFGGDPDRVTMFGESAGAENILALMFAGPAQSLFKRAILQSTSGFGVDGMSSLADEQRRGEELARLMGFGGSGSLDGLRRVPAAEVLGVYEDAFSDYYHSPALDGVLLSTSPWDSIQDGRFADHQLMIGSNADEWLDDIDADASPDDVAHTAAELRQLDGPRALATVAAETDPREAIDRLITSEKMLCPSQITAAGMTAAGRDAWVYYFTRVREGPAGAKLGAYHGAEYPYALGTHDAYMATDDVDTALTETMMDYWVQFAATGDPNSVRTPDWPPFATGQKRMQELGNEVRTIAAPEPELCALFDEWNARRD